MNAHMTHGDLLAYVDQKWPDPRAAPEVLRVPMETFNSALNGLEPVFRFSDRRLCEAGLVTLRLRPFGAQTSLVMDPTVVEPTPDTIEGVIARAATDAAGWPLRDSPEAAT